MKVDTEAQRIVIELVSGCIREAVAELFEKIKELDNSDGGSESAARMIIMTRIDVLGKLDEYLLKPLNEHYLFIENGSDVIEPGMLFSAHEEMMTKFKRKILQGL